MKKTLALDMQIFIISWKNQHSNAVFIANKLKKLSSKICIIYSDADENIALDVDCEQIRRPNDLFWSDKFKACLDTCGDDPMLVIHADCTCSNWEQLVYRCDSVVTEMPYIGVWSPKIEWVGWVLSRWVISKITDNILAVGRTDGIVFYLSQDIIQRMRCVDYSQNIYGRGIELMFVMAAYARGLIAVIDTTILVKHPKATGYDKTKANSQMQEFLKQLTIPEFIQKKLIDQNRKIMVDNENEFLKKNKKTNDY